MGNKATGKDFYREIKGSLGRFLSIFFIVALGVAFFSGIRASQPAMLRTGDAYFDDNLLMDIKAVSTLGITEDDVEAVNEVDGVEYAVGGYSVDAICRGDEYQRVLHVMSLTEDMNIVDVTEGRLPEKAGECLIDANSGYEIGDVIWIESGTDTPITDTLEKDKLTVVGKGTTSYYLSFGRGSTMIGTGSISHFAIVSDVSFCMDVYTELYVRVEGAKGLTAYTDEYEDRVEEVLDNIEKIADKRAKVRTDEVISEANEELTDAQRELDEAKTEVEMELADAWIQITDGERQLNDAKAQIADGEIQLANARKMLTEKQAELDNGKKSYEEGWEQYQNGLKQFEQGQEEYETGLVEYETGLKEYEAGLLLYNEQYALYEEQIVQYEALKAYYEANKGVLSQPELAYYEKLIADAEVLFKPLYDAKAELDAAKEVLDAAKTVLDQTAAMLIQSKQTLDATGVQLADVKFQLDEGQAQILEGWKEISQQEVTLQEAKAEINKSEIELADAKKEYEEGKLEAETELADAEKELIDAREEIDAIEPAKWYVYDRSTLPDHDGLGDNADRIAAIGKVFPILFFLVAALISLTSMTRMVEEQRTQIGTMKALGYDKFAISAKYLGYALIATLGGSVLGVLVGEKVIPLVITYAYCNTVYQNVTNYIAPYNMYYAVLATAAALVCTVAATLFSCYKELMSQPAVLMRPPAPKKGKRVLLERVTFIWKRLSFIWKSTVRNLFRYKKRFFMTVFGIGGCMALLLVGFGIKDSIGEISDAQFTRIQVYDGMAYLHEDASEEEMDKLYDYLNTADDVSSHLNMYMSTVTLLHEEKEWEVYLSVPEDEENFKEFVVLADRLTQKKCELTDAGVVVNEKTAKMLDVQVGDTVEIKDTDKGNHKVVIIDICENYTGHYVYMTKALYEELYGESYEANCIYFTAAESDDIYIEKTGKGILAQDAVLNVSYLFNQAADLQNMLSTLDLVVFVLIISAALLAFVVLYNLNNINITERRRELATLKVLGFFDGEVSAYVFRENGVLTVIGTAAGVILGKILHQFVIVTVEVDEVMFGRVINFPSYIYSIILTILFAMFVNWLMHFKLKKIDMVESLKSVE